MGIFEGGFHQWWIPNSWMLILWFMNGSYILMIFFCLLVVNGISPQHLPAPPQADSAPLLPLLMAPISVSFCRSKFSVTGPSPTPGPHGAGSGMIRRWEAWEERWEKLEGN